MLCTRAAFNIVIVVLAGALCPAPAATQSTPSALARGVQQYRVQGFYDGGEMEPWESELSVADTTLGPDAAVRVKYEARRQGAGFLFTYAAIWKRDDAAQTRMTWSGRGRVPSACTLERSGDQIVGQINDTPVAAPVTARLALVPDFALGAYLATRAVQSSDSLRVSVVRCLPGARTPIEVHEVRLHVKSDSAARGEAGLEPAWLVQGPSDYAIKVWVAKSDHQILRSEIPQGVHGYSLETYLRTR
jgi:hypothetical protein